MSKNKINPALINHILSRKGIVQYLEEKGIKPVKKLSGGRLSFLCPFPDHSEKQPSFMVWTNSEYENFHCFGCFKADSPVMLSSGFEKPIQEIKKNDQVISAEGKPRRVIRVLKREYQGNFIRLSLKKFPDLEGTEDHEVYVLRYKTKGLRRPIFIGNEYGHWWYKYESSPVRVKMRDCRIGDCLCSPVYSFRGSGGESRADYLRFESQCGPRPKKLPLIEFNEDLLFLFGLYAAEGSSCGRLVRFSLGSDEKELLDRVEAIVAQNFGLKTNRFYSPDRKSVDIYFCHSLLSRQFKEWFGSDCYSKRLPQFIFNMSENRIRSVLDGILTGDGYHRFRSGRSDTYRLHITSRILSMQVFQLANRLMLYPSWRIMPPRGMHKVSYIVDFSTGGKNRIGRYVSVDNAGFYCLPITSIASEWSQSEVYNLTVDEDHSYIVNGLAVGNCQRHHNIIHLVAGMEGISFRESLERLSDGVEISIDDNVKFASDQILKATSDWKHARCIQGLDLAEQIMSISSLCRTYLESVGNDPKEQCIIDKLFERTDQELFNFEFEGIEETLLNLPVMLGMRRERYEQLKYEEWAKQYASRTHD